MKPSASTKQTIFTIIILIIICSIALFLRQKTPAKVIPNNTFSYNNKPIHPDCLYDFLLLSPDKTTPDTVDLATCMNATSEITTRTSSENNTTPITGYLADHYYTPEGETEPIQEGWTQYKVIKDLGITSGKNHEFIIQLTVNSGGSGVFSEVQKIKITKDAQLQYISTILAGGDRCNGGIDVDTAYVDNDSIIIHTNVTPYDLLYLASTKSEAEKTKLFDGLDSSAIACVGTMQHTYNLKDNSLENEISFVFPPTIKDEESGNDVLPLLTENSADFPDNSESSQKNLIFNKLYNNYLKAGRTKLSREDIVKFSDEFSNSISQ